MTHRRRGAGRAAPLRAGALLVLAVVAGACGDGGSSTPAPTRSATASVTRTAPPTATTVATRTAAATPTDTAAATASPTATGVPTGTSTATVTDTPTPTASPTLALPTGTATATVTPPPSEACVGKNGAAGSRQVTITSGGLERSFQLIVPASALHGQPVALVLHFHGVFGTGAEAVAVAGLEQKAAAEGFIVAAGNGTGRSWNAGVCCDPAAADGVDDVGFTRDMLAAIEREYCVDATRVYATGFSNGSAMVFRLACEASDRFAAFAPVGGSLALFPCAPERPRPMQVINNVMDPVVAFALGEFSFGEFLKHNACSAARETREAAANATCQTAPDCADGATTELCAVDGVGHQWPGGLTNPDGAFKATDAVWEFFAAH